MINEKLIIYTVITFVLLFITSCTSYHGRDAISHSLYMSAFEKHKQGDYKGAVIEYNEVIKRNPNDAGALFGRGRSNMELHNFKEAIKDFDEVLRLNSFLADAYLQRAYCKLQINDCEGAEEDILKAIYTVENAKIASFKEVQKLIQLGCTPLSEIPERGR